MSSGPLPTLDVDHLSAMTGGDASLAIEIIDIFRQQTELWSRMLNPSLPAQQWADAAHSLKGTALSVGAMRLSEACKAAETLGRSDGDIRLAQAAAALAAVKDEIGPAIEAAARVAHQLSGSGVFKASKEPNS